MKLDLEDRVKSYNQSFGKRFPASKLSMLGGYIVGIWMVGNYFRNKTRYYGAYPHGYLERIKSLFPDAKEILHVFSGSVTEDQTFDIRPTYFPSYLGDAHNLAKIVMRNRGERKFDVLFVDPPYSGEDANHYGTPMINRNKVIKECIKVTKSGGFIVWLDQVYPMYRKNDLKLVGTIGLIRSTNHRVRMVFIFRKN